MNLHSIKQSDYEKDWPDRVLAPCRPDGEVLTIDYDTKEAACFCEIRNCLVDDMNKIIPPGNDMLGRKGNAAYWTRQVMIIKQFGSGILYD